MEAEEQGEQVADITLPPERIAELAEQEEILLTVTSGGLGKRSSAYDYRVAGRGGMGITNILLGWRNGNGAAVVASFPVRDGDDVMLVTDAGRLIRVPVDQVRVTGRASQGVMLFRVDDSEHVTSVSLVVEPIDGDGAAETTAANDDA